MFSDAPIDDYHEHGKSDHVIISRRGTTLCPSPFDNPAGEDIISPSRCLLYVEKKHVATNRFKSLLLRADRYSRNLNCEIDRNVCRMVVSTGNSIIYQGILRRSGTQVAIKTITRFMPDSDMIKVNAFDDLLSHWMTNHLPSSISELSVRSTSCLNFATTTSFRYWASLLALMEQCP